jgi:hypothetical protein
MNAIIEVPKVVNPFFGLNYDRFKASSYDGSSPPARRILGKHPAGEAGIAAGLGGIGKSYLMLIQMEEATSKGITCIGVFSEDSRATIDRRLKTIRDKTGWVPKANSMYIATSDIDIDCALLSFDQFQNGLAKMPLLEWLEFQLEAINAAGEDAIVVIDNFTTLIRVESNKAEHAGVAMAMLTKLAQKTGACIYVLHHVNKEATTDHRKSIRGSGGIVDQGRFAQVLHEVESAVADLLREKLKLPSNAEIVTMQVVKSNGGMKQASRHYVREDDGFLRELPSVEFVTDDDALVQLISESSAKGVFFTKSGKVNGLYACRNASWPGRIGTLGKNALQNLAGRLISGGKLNAGPDGTIRCSDA